MKGCKRIRKIISEYIDGELSREQYEIVEAHLADCRTCDEVITRIKSLKHQLKNINQIQTSSDFDTILRTRIKIESGIGRRRLHEIVWTWPVRIPIYGMSLALIVIATVMVFEQVKKNNQAQIPDAYVNPQWYGGNPEQNSSSPVWKEEGDNVIFVIDRVSPSEYLKNQKDSMNQADSANKTYMDSSKTANVRLMQVNDKVY